MIIVSVIQVRELWIPAQAGIQRGLLVAETMIEAYPTTRRVTIQTPPDRGV